LALSDATAHGLLDAHGGGLRPNRFQPGGGSVGRRDQIADRPASEMGEDHAVPSDQDGEIGQAIARYLGHPACKH